MRQALLARRRDAVRGRRRSAEIQDMESSHRHLRITSGEWDAFMDDVAQALDKFAVPAAERAEVVAIIESTRRSDCRRLIRGGSSRQASH